MVLGDMLDSAKLSGNTGHTGYSGDRFSEVKGAKCTTGKKAQYYPTNPPGNLNQDRPKYNLRKLPHRTSKFFWNTIQELIDATSERMKKEIAKMKGISRMTIVVASPAFLDPQHLLRQSALDRPASSRSKPRSRALETTRTLDSGVHRCVSS